MAETTVLTSSPQAIKLFSVSLHAETIRKTKFLRLMSGGVSNQSMALAKTERQQSTPHMPIVIIDDLTNNAGDKVTVDMFRVVQGKPFMGDTTAEGRGAPLSFSNMEVRIDQSRFPISAGSNMTQKRTAHNLRKIARAEMVNWFARYNDQCIQVHLAGARGDDDSIDWIIPKDNDPEFNSIMINPVEPPTSNRYFVAGGGDDVSSIGNTDALTLEDLDVIVTNLREQALPPAGIELNNVYMEDDNPVWCLLVSQRQWHYIETRLKANISSWRQFLADAAVRAATTKHPLFKGEAGMWNSLLIKKMTRPIRFNAGTNVSFTNAATGAVDSSKAVPSGLTVDRAILLGGQALALARGSAGNKVGGPFPMRWSEVMRDHGNSLEVLGAQMDGKRKFRFVGSDNMTTDFGVAVIDSYAPDPGSTAGASLRTALGS